MSGRGPSICFRRPFGRSKAPLGLSLLTQTRISRCCAEAGVVPVRLHRSGTAVRILELYSTSCRAAKSSSPVRILTTRVTL